ncbi:hypothetical protein [Yersinia enterocolitica]|uniref:hypothetical protein n=1 Tax=Yersinia enterocolitica TaxID=630 RepID=UPI003D00BBF7
MKRRSLRANGLFCRDTYTFAHVETMLLISLLPLQLDGGDNGGNKSVRQNDEIYQEMAHALDDNLLGE